MPTSHIVHTCVNTSYNLEVIIGQLVYTCTPYSDTPEQINMTHSRYL